MILSIIEKILLTMFIYLAVGIIPTSSSTWVTTVSIVTGQSVATVTVIDTFTVVVTIMVAMVGMIVGTWSRH